MPLWASKEEQEGENSEEGRIAVKLESFLVRDHSGRVRDHLGGARPLGASPAVQT